MTVRPLPAVLQLYRFLVCVHIGCANMNFAQKTETLLAQGGLTALLQHAMLQLYRFFSFGTAFGLHIAGAM